MSEAVVIVGLGADGLASLRPDALEAVRRATFLAGGRRHLDLVGARSAEAFPITDNIDALIGRLTVRGPCERCVVLASGDPLYFGIGHRIIQAIGRDQVRVEPAVSGMQLAFARVKLSWHDATIASVHGRALIPTLLPLLGRPKIGLFTNDGDSPSRIARFFCDRGLRDTYDAWVCENLQTAEESVSPASLCELVGRRFADLNIMVLSRRGLQPAMRLSTADDAFARPDSGPVLLTHEDVRTLVVRRFQGCVPGPIWDIGAGLGGVSVDLARRFPERDIVAAERSPAQLEFLKTNRTRFEAFNVRVVEGEAPECLDGEERPAGVFVGGSGGRLDAILGLVTDRLLPGGRLVANFVGLENMTAVLAGLRRESWRVDLCQVQISEGRQLAGLTTLAPQRPVWIIRADKP